MIKCQSKFINVHKHVAYQGVNFIRITTKFVHCISHASKINNSRYPSKILTSPFNKTQSTEHHKYNRHSKNFTQSNNTQHQRLHDTHLQKHPSWLERNLHLFGRGILPINNFFNVMFLNLKLITVTDCRFQKYPHRIRKSICRDKQMNATINSQLLQIQCTRKSSPKKKNSSRSHQTHTTATDKNAIPKQSHQINTSGK